MDSLKESVARLSRQLRLDAQESYFKAVTAGAQQEVSPLPKTTPSKAASLIEQSDAKGTFLTSAPIVVEQDASQHGCAVTAHIEKPLPAGLNITLLAENALEAHYLPLRTKQHFRSYIKTPQASRMMTALAWVVAFDSRKGPTPDPNERQLLFSRASQNFVALIFIVLDRERDLFVRKLPHIMAESIFHSLSNCFPDVVSHPDFSQRQLLETVFVWITGRKPYLLHWKPWTSQIKINRRVAIKLGAGSSGPTIELLQTPDDDATGRSSGGSVMVNRLKSHPVGSAPTATVEQFDVHGISPMVKEYFKAFKQPPKVGPQNILKLSTVPLGDIKGPTYQHAIETSIAQSRTATKAYASLTDTINRARSKVVTDLSTSVKETDRILNQILSDPHGVKERATTLLGWDKSIRSDSLPPIIGASPRQSFRLRAIATNKGRHGPQSRVFSKMQIVPLQEHDAKVYSGKV